MSTPKLSTLLNSYDTFMFDADGVLWLKGKVIPGSPDFVNYLLENDKKVIIPSNGSTTMDEYVEKAQKMGYKINEENVILTSKVTAAELKKMGIDQSLHLYVVGSKNLQKVLEEEGFKCFGPGPEKLSEESATEDDLKKLCSIPISTVVASDDRDFHYYKLMRSVNYLRDSKINFVVTNEDLFDPGPIPDFVYPATGWVMHSIAKLTERTPKIMGKPHKPMFDYLMEKCGIDPKRTIMIGDRCDTDIAFGNKFGMDTMLILTGVCSLGDIENFKKEGKNDFVPTYTAECLASLLGKDCKVPEE